MKTLRAATWPFAGCLVLLLTLACQEDDPAGPHSPPLPTISFLQPELTVREPAGVDSGVEVAILRSDPAPSARVKLALRFLTADGQDCRLPDPWVRFGAGDDTAWTRLELVPDTLREEEERLALVLDSLPPEYVRGARAELMLRLRDRAAPAGPAISFLQPQIVLREGAADLPYAGIRIPIVRSGGEEAVNVPVELQPLTTEPRELLDMRLDAGFAAGADTSWVLLVSNPDADVEGVEQAVLSLGALPAGYSPGWWPQVDIRLEDVPVHTVPFPAAWPLDVGDSWTFQDDWLYCAEDAGCRSSDFDRLGNVTAEVTERVRYRGREYIALEFVFDNSPWPSRRSLYFTTAGDSLYFVPASDTLRIPEELRAGFPWLLAVFGQEEIVERTYYRVPAPPGSGITFSGRQAPGAARAVPAGAWDRTLRVEYRRYREYFDWYDEGESWAFDLAAEVGPVRLWYERYDEGVFWDSIVGVASLTRYNIRP